MLGEPLANRRVKLTQPGEPSRKMRSDAEGCFAFEAVQDKAFTVLFKGPKVPADDD